MSAEKFQQYQNQKIMTASPAMLVFMLYEKAIGCLKEAVQAIEDGRIEDRWKANKRAMEIVEHMRFTLNTEDGGEIATNLDGIYGYLLRELPKVDLKNDPQPALEGIKLLQPLCESWRQIAENGEGAVTHGAPDTSQDTHHPTSKNSPPKTAGGYGSTATERASGDSGQRSNDVPKAGGITISA